MDKRQRALAILEDARNRHISFKFNLPGTQLMVFSLDKDTAIPMGSYIVDPRITKAARNGGMLYSLQLDAADVDRLVREAEEEIERQQAEGHEEAVVPITSPSSQSFSMSLVPIVRQTDESPFTFLDLLLCLAQDDAADADERAAIIDAMNALRDDDAVILSQDAIKPTTHIEPTTKLANKITEIVGGEDVSLDVTGARDKKPVYTAVRIDYEGEGVELSRSMKRFDVEVANAVLTVWKAGNRTFTAGQVWYALTGSEARPSKAQLKRTERVIDMLRRTLVTIDFTAEARGRSLNVDGDPLDSCRIEGYYIPANKVMLKSTNGKAVEGYMMVGTPIFYTHAAALRQVVTYDMKLLDMPDAGQNTDENIVIKNYLLRRIEGARRGKMNKRITYQAIYKEAEIENPDKQRRLRVRNFVKGCLDALVGKKHIGGYSEYKNGRSIAGVDIEV